MTRLTASKLALARVCPPALVLSAIESNTPLNLAGHKTHDQIDRAVKTYASPTDERALAAWGWLINQGLMGPGTSSEVSFALNVLTGEVRRVSRPYPDLPAEWIPGTVDLAVATGEVKRCANCGAAFDEKRAAEDFLNDEPVVDCPKPSGSKPYVDSGYGGHSFTRSAPAQLTVIDWKSHHVPSDEQLAFAAYCIARMAEVADESTMPPVRAAYVSLGDEVTPHWREFTDHAATLAMIRGIWEGVRRARADACPDCKGTGSYYTEVENGYQHWDCDHSEELPDPHRLIVRTGDHCSFCASLLSCPATRAAADLMRPVPEFPLPSEQFVALLHPTVLAQALTAWRRVGKVGELLEARGHQLAKQGQLPGYRLREYEVDVLDGPAAYEYLSATAGRTAARAAVEIETSKTKIRAALKLYHLCGEDPPEDILRHLIEDQEARGLLTKRPVTRLEAE